MSRARVGRAVGLALLAAAWTLANGGAIAHTGGSNGYAVVMVDGERVRYTLTLWPAALPAAIVERLGRARDGDAASGEALLGLVRDKITLQADGRRCQPDAGRVAPPGQAESLTL
ncbi:MAG TPA: hypothetical protein VFW70_00335, partial [Methylomirabilota bacterium]|nr:hypothetical protein [Methylomirabilota bacterium]